MSPDALAQAEARPGAERPAEPRPLLAPSPARAPRRTAPTGPRRVASPRARCASSWATIARSSPWVSTRNSGRPMISAREPPQATTPQHGRYVRRTWLGRLDAQPAPDRVDRREQLRGVHPREHRPEVAVRDSGSPPGTRRLPAWRRPPTSRRSRCAARPASPARSRRTPASPACRSSVHDPVEPLDAAGASSCARPASSPPSGAERWAAAGTSGPPRPTRPPSWSRTGPPHRATPRLRVPSSHGSAAPRAPPRIRGIAARAKPPAPARSMPLSAPLGLVETPRVRSSRHAISPVYLRDISEYSPLRRGGG